VLFGLCSTVSLSSRLECVVLRVLHAKDAAESLHSVAPPAGCGAVRLSLPPGPLEHAQPTLRVFQARKEEKERCGNVGLSSADYFCAYSGIVIHTCTHDYYLDLRFERSA
jgi:hypothetical protein